MKKVVIGMSGGVDSSVAAILLKEAGYEVTGLFMRNWDSTINNDILGNPQITDNICPQEQDYNDALLVCEKLNIPLHRVDFIKEYWDYVFTYFLEELKLGRTPNPDIMCNKFIKFEQFKQEAKRLGADFIATGHYAKIENNKLYRALDKNKDQSYFLGLLTTEQLEEVIFPLGDLTKEEVRKIANKYNLITANKRDSTGICFIGERKFQKFLQNYLPNQKGQIVNIETKGIIGTHIGLMYYTIGQRRGLNIGGGQKKLYVVGKNLDANILYVAYGDKNEYLYSDEALIDNLTWRSNYEVKSCTVKFRYRQRDIKAQLNFVNETTVIVKYDPTIAVTPGQACIFYNDEECLGGGLIKEVRKNNVKIKYL